MTTHCPQEQISAWLDRQLGEAEAAQVECHLGQCESCRQFQKELELTTGWFRNLNVLEPPDYLWTRIAAALEQPAERKRPAWLRLPEVWSYRREWLAAAAALIVMIAGIVFIVEQQASKRSEMATIAQIDRYHAALLAKNPKIDNPFRISVGIAPDSNPFARRQIDANANPFGSVREKR
jgi:hypothetical protein